MRDEEGDTLLHIAAGAGDISATEWLLRQGADINAKNNSGNAVLHFAILSNSIEVAALLLDGGAKVDISDNNGDTPLHWANMPNHEDSEPLNQPKLPNNPKMASLLLSRGAKVNARNHKGMPPLYGAVESGLEETVEVLLANQADVNIQDHSSYTLLHYLVRKADPVLMQLFLKYSPKLNVPDKNGKTPLYLAASSGSQAIMQQLLKRGAYTYIDESTQKILHTFFPNCRDQLPRAEERFYTILLLAGVKSNNQELHEQVKPLHALIETTIKLWLNASLPQNLSAQIDWSKTTFQVLRALPRLIQFVKEVNSIIETELSVDYTINNLKEFLFVPNNTSTKITAEEQIRLQNRLSVLQDMINAGMPVETVLNIKDCLIDQVMVESLVSGYQLNRAIVDYLWQDCKNHLDDYIDFHKRIFQHDWKNTPCPLPRSLTVQPTSALAI